MCTEDINLFATDEFYAGILHVPTAIEVTVQLFGAYIILTKTPRKICSVKFNMVLLHIVGAIVDLYLSFIASPMLTLPVSSGYPLGFSLILGIPTDVQVYLGCVFVGVMCVAVTIFFEDRYHRLIHGHTTNGSLNWKRTLYVVLNYTISVTFIIPAYLKLPNPEVAKQYVKNINPCIPNEVLNRREYFVFATDNTIVNACLLSMFFICLPQKLYFLGAIFRYFSQTVSLSATTARLQKQFFYSMCIQIFIPVAFISLPVSYFVMASENDYYNQAATNIAMIAIACHGVLSTIVMLIVHTPHRKSILATLHFKSEQAVRNSQLIWKTVVSRA